MNIHLFNPENDLALAAGCRQYTPPPNARAIHKAGALLPMWWAEEDDIILAPTEMSDEARNLSERFGLKGCISDITHNISDAHPWGWSLDAKRQFINFGVDESVLPTDCHIERMRQLGHRRISIEILKRIDTVDHLPVETTNAIDIVRIERQYPGCYVKSPWSGSGRGVFCAGSLNEDALLRRAEGIIHRQGSVIIERGLDKILDFAALFHSDGKEVSFRGLSIFSTEARGMYNGNIVSHQKDLEKRLSDFIDLRNLRSIVEQETDVLTELVASTYNGWLGIDMMIHRENGKFKIMPCVEMNLRMTMGVVAMKIQERLGLKTPHFMSWRHNDPHTTTISLLPPVAGFRLTLSPTML